MSCCKKIRYVREEEERAHMHQVIIREAGSGAIEGGKKKMKEKKKKKKKERSLGKARTFNLQINSLTR